MNAVIKKILLEKDSKYADAGQIIDHTPMEIYQWLLDNTYYPIEKSDNIDIRNIPNYHKRKVWSRISAMMIVPELALITMTIVKAFSVDDISVKYSLSSFFSCWIYFIYPIYCD